ncbi:glycosyltransferase family 2 protein [Nocardioides sp.]|uniref:glycosyltransferase family 2 protein n=1 Tax=Nocardioides sp. TaxID=35761 RepID=UPI00286C8ED9|nr:glycosyltransferase family 2 protein [Nocardioides sp.]
MSAPQVGTDVCVVVAAYNEATVVGDVVRGLARHFTQVLVVDDGSTDDTSRVAREAGAMVVRHAINLGQGAALQTGFDYALKSGGITHVVTFDADGQHRPDDALRLLAQGRSQGYDVVLGSRTLGKVVDQPWQRALLLRAAVTFSRRTSGLDLTDTHNGLRVLSRDALRSISLRQCGMAYASELEHAISRSGLPWCEVPVEIVYTEYSCSKGQRGLNMVNILFDLVHARIKTT